jgi:secondary thiamine-phosphate synthase enzyme
LNILALFNPPVNPISGQTGWVAPTSIKQAGIIGPEEGNCPPEVGMVVRHEVFKLETEARPSFYDVTERVKAFVKESGVREGIVVVYSQHTTCSIIIQEDSYDTTYNGTKFIFQDLLDVFNKIIPECKKEGQYMHPGPLCVDNALHVINEPLPYTLNTDAHLRASVMGRSETIPIVQGEVQLGEFGCVYFADFDGTRTRERLVRIQILGE